MRVFTTIADARAFLDDVRRDRRSVGLVPTMGYLHAGHASLVEASVAANDVTLVTVFVNPLQFAPDEDLAAYPRDLDADVALAGAAGADAVLAPSVDEMYPQPIATTVTVGGISARLEGASRPTHFDGVSTVVAKLFAIAGPCRAYFGEKDFQQLAIVRRMAFDLSLPVEVVGCPIVREPDGLAMSSRNVYLTDAERSGAPVLHRALRLGVDLVERGERSSAVVRRAMLDLIAAVPEAAVDYVAIVDAATFDEVDPLAGEIRLLVAVRFGRARLIDNVGVDLG